MRARAGRLGGTCVNVGCVPKKVMWHAAEAVSSLKWAHEYGIDLPPASGDVDGSGLPAGATFTLRRLKASRDAYVTRLNGIYRKNLEGSGVRLYEGRASFTGPRAVRVVAPAPAGGGAAPPAVELEADAVLIATGGTPWVPHIPGGHLCITSDGFFDLQDVPKRVAGGSRLCYLHDLKGDCGAGMVQPCLLHDDTERKATPSRE